MSRSFVPCRRRAGLAVLAASLVAMLGFPAPVRAQDQPGQPSAGGAQGPEGVVQSWAVSPGDGTTATAGRANMSYELAPGTAVDDQITVYNLSNVAMTLKVYSTDAFNTPDGAFALLAGDQKPTDVGTWVQFNVEGVTLPAGTQTTLPVRINVPADARPGDHAGAIVASSPTQGTGPDGKIVNVDRRTGTRVYVRVSGPLQPKLAVEGLKTSYSPSLNPFGGDAEVHYKIVNRGNVRLAGTHKVKFAGPFGLFGKSTSEDTISELLPGQSVDVTKKLSGVTATGLLSATVELQPKPIGADTKPLSRNDHKGYTIAVPLLLVALFLIALLLWYARRRYQRHANEVVPVVERPKEPLPV